jgi:hypothetical protein
MTERERAMYDLLITALNLADRAASLATDAQESMCLDCLTESTLSWAVEDIKDAAEQLEIRVNAIERGRL